MKVYIPLLLLLIQTELHAQHLVPDGSVWFSHGYDVFSGQPGNPTYCNFDWQTKVIGDTVFGGDTLQILLHEQFSQCSGSGGGGYGAYTVYLKKDSNQIFYGEQIDSLELLYDFDLAVGDTVVQKTHYIFGPYIDTVVVISVDSVIYSGQLRKRIKFEDFEFPSNNTLQGMEWVEGIGDVHYGLNLMNYNCHPNIELECFISGQETLIGQCYLDSKSLTADESSITIYPNPFTDFINIQSDFAENVTIKIMDMNGKLVYEEHQFKSQIQFNLSFLEAGHYIAQISTPSETFSARIVKLN